MARYLYPWFQLIHPKSLKRNKQQEESNINECGTLLKEALILLTIPLFFKSLGYFRNHIHFNLKCVLYM